MHGTARAGLASFALLFSGCAAAASVPRGAAECAPSPGTSSCRCVPGSDAHRSVGGFFREHFSRDAWHDFVVEDSVKRGELAVPLALGVGVLFAQPIDHDVARSVRGALGNHPIVGDVGQIGLVATAIGTGLFAPNPARGAYEETWTQVEAFAATFGVVEGLKYAVETKRPDASDFFSFPSGHTAAAFCAATLIARDKGPVWGVPAYGVAALTGFSRMESGKHYLSDVLAGAAIGTGVATIIDALHFGDGRPGEGISSVPISLQGGTTADGRPEVEISVDF